MPTLVWIDGKLVDKNDAKLSVFDHGLLFGDGLWEGMRVYRRRVFLLKEHLAALVRTAAAIALPLPLSTDDLAAAIQTTLEANDRNEGYVRVTITRGTGTLTLDPRKCSPCVIIIAEDVVPYPREVYESGLDVITTAASVVCAQNTVDPLRTLSHRAWVRAKTEALQAGCLESLILDAQGNIVGGSETSVARVHAGTVTFAPGCATHTFVADRARAAGLPVEVRSFLCAELTTADEVFLTSAAAEVIGVRSIDGRAVGSGTEGPVTRLLRDAYRAAVRSDG